MKMNKWVAVLATGLVLAVAAPVSAQFGGLGALKKKLETVAKELEKPKQTPPASPSPARTGPATPQGRYAKPVSSLPSVPVDRTEQPISFPREPTTEVATIVSQNSETKIQKLGPDFPSNLQISSGGTPKFIQTSLSTVTDCILGSPEGGDDRSYRFNMIYTPKTENIQFGPFELLKQGKKQGDWQLYKATSREVYENVGIFTEVKSIKIVYTGFNEENYYFKIIFVSQHINYEIASSTTKDWIEDLPEINAKFSTNWTLSCQNPDTDGSG